MGAAEHLEGHTVLGKRSKTKWVVNTKITTAADLSGASFSVGYKVTSEDGTRQAFLKASDLDLLTNDDAEFFDRMKTAFDAHKFERDILEYCRGNNMDRIVTALDYGEALVTVEQVRDGIFYLIFEMAKCDARVQVSLESRFNFAWSIVALHDLAVAVQQLHSGKVSHNDIKPANLLVFNAHLQKLADLGRATSPSMPAAHDDKCCVGDPKYAAPELLYALDGDHHRLSQFNLRRSSDLYQLGSMAHFLVTGRMMTPEVIMRMSPEHRPPSDGNGWSGPYEAVLPYWQSAYNRTLDTVRLQLDGSDLALRKIGTELFEVIVQLCEPDPAHRGHPLNRSGHQDRLSVARYVALFARMRLEIAVKGNA